MIRSVERGIPKIGDTEKKRPNIWVLPTTIPFVPNAPFKESPLHSTQEEERGRINSVQKMKTYLMRWHGVGYPQKRRLIDVPIITEDDLVSFAGINNVAKYKKCISKLGEYLDDYPVTDQFGSHHDERRTWRKKFEGNGETERSFFTEAYEKHNILRGNKITCVTGYMQMLEKYLNMDGKNQYSGLIGKIRKEILFAVEEQNKVTSTNGSFTNNEETINRFNKTRLQMVAWIQDKIIEVLWYFASENTKREPMLVV